MSSCSQSITELMPPAKSIGAPRESKKPDGFPLVGRRGICQNGVPMDAPVVIVGAGVAGLCAAHHLRAAGRGVVVLEASDNIGGRVRAREGFSDFPIELGAEELHGP